MPNKIYDQHSTAFRDVSAWVICKGGDRVATVAIKYGGRRSPNGLTVRAYVHILGLPMVRGTARGGGYDMKSAAVYDAVRNLALTMPEDSDEGDPTRALLNEMVGAPDGPYWDDSLRKAGYQVFQAV